MPSIGHMNNVALHTNTNEDHGKAVRSRGTIP